MSDESGAILRDGAQCAGSGDMSIVERIELGQEIPHIRGVKKCPLVAFHPS